MKHLHSILLRKKEVKVVVTIIQLLHQKKYKLTPAHCILPLLYISKHTRIVADSNQS